MNIKKLSAFILIILSVCAALILFIWYILTGNTQLRDSLIAEIVGGGILGSIVAGTFFYLQESGEYQASKQKALSFYEDKLFLDINEVFDRSPSPFNFSGLHKFYFDGSRINALYDAYVSNFNEINNYTAHYKENEFVNIFNEFYKEARKGYVLGEKLEGAIYQIVRREHHRRDLADAHDFVTQTYIKGHLFVGVPDSDIARYIAVQSIPARMQEIVQVFKENPQALEFMKEVKTARTNLLLREKEIEDHLRGLRRSKAKSD